MLKARTPATLDEDVRTADEVEALDERIRRERTRTGAPPEVWLG